MVRVITHSAAETEAVGCRLASRCKGGTVVAFFGAQRDPGKIQHV